MLNLLPTILVAALTAFLGYWVGSAKFYKEHQIKMYGDALPAFLEFMFERTPAYEAKYNAAVARV